MVKRTISGLIGGLLVIVVIIFNQRVPMITNLFISLVCILTTHEIYCAMGISRIFSLMIPSLIFTAILPIFGFGALWKLSLYLYSLFIFCIMVIKRDKLSVKDVTVAYSMTLLISLSLNTIIELRNWAGVYSNFYVLLALATPWMSDTGAYFSGKLFGKNKLCPDVSPKKTIEGAIGGIIFSVLANLFICFIFETFLFKPKAGVNYLCVILLVFLGAIFSIIGDMCFSMVKRSYRVKDFGNVIPGHGGLLDRFDSVIFVAPFVYCVATHIDLIRI
ncbi:MAG: phosphatidate cytidylyltransferase [Clostridia bacterium]|nr:phosphatidate cytidylyltransferase [Clostridia bacterium]